MERDAQPEVDYVLLPAGRERPATPRQPELADAAVDEVGHRRERDVAAHPDVVPDPRREPPARARYRRTRVRVVARKAKPPTQEEAVGGDGIIEEGRGDIAERLGCPPAPAGPTVDRAS